MRNEVDSGAVALAERPNAADVQTSAVPEHVDAGAENYFAATIFLGAFLLFQVQLLLGKLILPWFGGTPAVWTTCLLFFQLLLLAGYAYARVIAARFAAQLQGKVHLVLLGVSAALFVGMAFLWPTPVTPSANWKPAGDANPAVQIAKFLFVSIGLPFFLLSTTGPLVQHWFARRFPGRSPYRLYAVSNLGSLLGLLSYPFLIEPLLRLRIQGWLWSCGYIAYGVLCGACAVQASRSENVEREVANSQQYGGVHATWSQRVLWTSLAACASVLLLGTTNLISQEIAVIPFLWVLPLALYLVSFILCFESDRWYKRKFFHPLFAVTAAIACAVLLKTTSWSYISQLVAYSAMFFSACMVCHGEAACTRPEPHLLTSFYLSIATGGALGGVFVGVIAPHVFPNYWELPLGILACAGLLLHVSSRDPESWWFHGRRWIAPLVLAGTALMVVEILSVLWPKFPVHRNIWRAVTFAVPFVLGIFLLLRDGFKTVGRSERKWVRLACVFALLVLTLGLAIPAKLQLDHVIARSRNFYGVSSVIDVQPENYLVFRHGRTIHGLQFRDPALSRLPTSYFGPQSGIYLLLTNHNAGPRRVGIIGMGAGTLAAMGAPGDYYRVYEINPDVVRWAAGEKPYFTYIRDSPAKIEVVVGDGRLSLEREAALGNLQKFDVLILDAFSSDAIPVHLLTREAFEIYSRHLRDPQSVIAVHITNSTLDLSPVVAGVAGEYGFSSLRIHRPWLRGLSSLSDWVLLSRDVQALSDPAIAHAGVALFGKNILWTDDFSNLLHVLK